jgi:hypothetical protein
VLFFQGRSLAAIRRKFTLPARLALTATVSPVATTTATTASAATPESSASAPAFSLGPGFVHRQRTATGIATVKGCNGSLGFIVVGHLDEPKPARAAGVAIRNDRSALNRAVSLEPLTQFSIGGIKRKVSNEYLFHQFPFKRSWLGLPCGQRCDRQGWLTSA